GPTHVRIFARSRKAPRTSTSSPSNSKRRAPLALRPTHVEPQSNDVNSWRGNAPFTCNSKERPMHSAQQSTKPATGDDLQARAGKAQSEFGAIEVEDDKAQQRLTDARLAFERDPSSRTRGAFRDAEDAAAITAQRRKNCAERIAPLLREAAAAEKSARIAE